jgi:hypothetical protein
MNVNSSIIRIVGLLGEIPEKSSDKLFQKFRNAGYRRDLYPVDTYGTKDTRSLQFLRDYFYPDFRNLMFLTDIEEETFRYIKLDNRKISLTYGRGERKKTYPIGILKSELYLFKEQIGLFSISIEIQEPHKNLDDISNIISVVKNFDTELENGTLWHHWISKELLANIPLRSTDERIVSSDEYSGSKFKVYSVLDFEHERQERKNHLYDIATSSPLGAGFGRGFNAPDEQYFDQIMTNRIAVFTNWEAVCLFDSFCCIGDKNLNEPGSISYISWDYTYFRIYLYRLFFKYNLYRYNSMINEANAKKILLRDQFESFLNKYNIGHISFNFLGNELFNKTGQALELDKELITFRERINNLSKVLQEERESKTNNLLQIVTLLSGITSVAPLIDMVNQAEKYLAWNPIIFYSIVSIIILTIVTGIIYYIFPELFKKIWKRKTSNLE